MIPAVQSMLSLLSPAQSPHVPIAVHKAHITISQSLTLVELTTIVVAALGGNCGGDRGGDRELVIVSWW